MWSYNFFFFSKMYVYLLSIIMNDICWFWDNFLFKFLMELEGVFVWVCLSVERVVGVIIFFKGFDIFEIFFLLGWFYYYNFYNNKIRFVYCFKFGNWYRLIFILFFIKECI